ncbi:hypothetical protein [Paenibacillus koleovorans]|uniref:hypothetical protein n=1 Tax=Paenibacillus koleovorans TaxID=121608 RepID=UPI000FD77AF4|nr:hypothetical protein [Paenibacillus koleovorans]
METPQEVVRLLLIEHTHTHIQHIALFFHVQLPPDEKPATYRESDDAAGAEWVELARFDESNASPLVVSAVHRIPGLMPADSFDSRLYDDWVVKPSEDRE